MSQCRILLSAGCPLIPLRLSTLCLMVSLFLIRLPPCNCAHPSFSAVSLSWLLYLINGLSLRLRLYSLSTSLSVSLPHTMSDLFCLHIGSLSVTWSYLPSLTVTFMICVSSLVLPGSFRLPMSVYLPACLSPSNPSCPCVSYPWLASYLTPVISASVLSFTVSRLLISWLLSVFLSGLLWFLQFLSSCLLR